MSASWLRILRLAASAVLLCSSSIAAERVPSDETGFTSYVADAFKRQLPNVDVTVVAPLTLKFGGSSYQANLDRVYDYCRRTPNNCDSFTRGYVANTVTLLKTNLGDVDRSQLRAVIRQGAYIDALRRQLRDRASDLNAENLVGDLFLVSYVDFPSATRPTMEKDLQSLGLSKEEAMALAKANVARVLRPLDTVTRDLTDRAIGTIAGDPYESSRLALHDEWAPIAARMGGELIVAVPAADKILYAKRVDARSVDALATLARQAGRQSDRPISTDVFHWAATGWELVSR